MIGARNSAAKAALDCYRHGAEVTLIVRGPGLSDKSQVLDQAGSREPDQRGQHQGVFQHDSRGDPRVVSEPPYPGRRGVDRQRLGARNDRLPSRLQLPRGDAADCDRGRPAPDTGVRSRHIRDEPARCLPRRNGVRRLSDRPVVHRERPLPRTADRQAHRARHDRKGRVPIGSIGKRRSRYDASRRPLRTKQIPEGSSRPTDRSRGKRFTAPSRYLSSTLCACIHADYCALGDVSGDSRPVPDSHIRTVLRDGNLVFP